MNGSMRNAHFIHIHKLCWKWLNHSGYLMQINETTHWSVGSPFASFSAHENAPLWSQQYVSTATVCPRYFFTLIGSEASLRNCSRPWIPMLTVWKDRCLKMMVYQNKACHPIRWKQKSPMINENNVTRRTVEHKQRILKSQRKTFPNRPTSRTYVKSQTSIYVNF